MPTPRPPSRLRKNLRAATLDGTLHAAMLGCGETYFPAYALLLGATPPIVGLLATLPLLAGATFQIFATRPAGYVGHKHWVVGSAIFQALLFIPIATLVWVQWYPLAWLFALACVYWMLALGINPAWNAWIGRMIPAEVRSRYFGRRNVPVQLMLFVSVTGGGLLLDAASRSSWGSASGFTLIFAIAAAARLGSAHYLTRQRDPGKGVRPPHVAIEEILRGMRSRPYGRLTWLLVFINGSVNISAAYFTPFMLQKLGLSYARFTALTAIVVVSRVLASAYWGEIARSYGNRRALQVSALLLIPLSGLWVLSDNFAYLVALQLFAGFAWSGFELASILTFFDCTDNRDRPQVLSLYALINAVAIVFGSLAGGTVLRILGDGGYPVIFLASSTCRALSLLVFGRGVGGRRHSGEHSFRNVLVRVITLRPGQGPGLRPLVLEERRRATRKEEG